MKKSTLLLFALFTILFQVNAQVTIGAGNLQTENAPFEPYFGYSYAQTIYLASEINASGTITDIQWYYSGTSALPSSQDLTIYMAEVAKTEFTSTTDWEPIASFTEVYAGGITVTAGTEGWVTLTLNTPFNYTGTGNLIIAAKENSAGYDEFGDDFYNSQVATNRTISYYSDSTNPDPTDPPTASNIDDTIPNIILGGITQACPNPTDISVTGVTATEAVISWTENGTSTNWNIEIVESGTAPTGTPTVTNVPNPYTVTSLNAVTGYDIYIQSDCGTEQSAFSGPVTFTTLCDIFIPDYMQDFTTIIPDCWEVASEGDPTSGPTDFGNSSWNSDNFLNNGTPSYNINVYGSAFASFNDWIITPQFDLTGGPFQVEFDFGITEWLSSTVAGTLGSDDTVQLLISNDNGVTWVNLLTYDNTSVIPIAGVHPVINLTAYSGQIVQFAIYATSGTVVDSADNDIFVDNFQVRNIPTCPEPQDINVTGITSNEAEFSWTEGGTATNWNIEIVPTGTAPTGTPTEMNVSNPYVVTGLDAITTYDFYVQAACGPGDDSSWTGPLTFATLCDVFVPDYLQDFTTITPDCWDVADNGDPTTGPTDLGNSSWVADEFLNIGADDGAYKINLFFNNKSDWLISPLFDLTGGPFQVEFDFAITDWNSSSNPGTLGSDDLVQLLMTNDGGATWITLVTYDSTSVVPITGAHPVVNLTAYSGQTVQFAIYATDGSIDDLGVDVDVFVDNFQVRNIPSCPEPSDLSANNLSLTSTEVAWVENGTATSWNIEYGEQGFALGTGTTETGVTTNPFTLTSLTPDTYYEFYVQAICGPGDESSWTGPLEFFTGYCESVPSSNDGDGINNVTVGVTTFPSAGDLTYENFTSTVVNVFQGLDTTVEIEFDHGFTYDTNIWIDFNDNLVFEDTELVFQGASDGIGDPQLYDASFIMPLTAPIGEHRMRIAGADFGQLVPDPCYTGTWGITLDFTVNVQELLCTLAEADYTTVPDCANDQFYIDVNITDLGDATSLEISNDYDNTTEQAFAVDTYQVGPFPFGNAVKIFVTNEQDTNCVISSDIYNVLACPPVNDDCVGAIEAVVNAGESCNQVNSGTILAATPSGVPGASCGGTPNDDVWFQFTALGEQQIIEIQNVVGGTFNIDHAVYEGSCGTLTELYCSADDFSITPALTPGETYYIRIFSAGSSPETSTFDLCIGTIGVPTYCLDALPICADPDIEYESVVGDQTAPPYLDYDCLGSQPDPQWNTINFDDPGDYVFTLEQTNAAGTGLDIDFIVWGPFVDQQGGCVELLPETIADCSFSAVSSETITLTDVPANSVYVLLITNYSQQSGTYTFVQDSGPTDGTNCDVVCDVTLNLEGAPVDDSIEDVTQIDEVFSYCGYDTGVLLEATTVYNVDSYLWYYNGFPIENYDEPTLTATESGTYQVQVLGGICDQSLTYFSAYIQINFYDDADPVSPQNITVCDGPEADGSESFNLDDLTASLNLDGFTVTYYTDVNDANQGINAITSTSDYVSSGETLIIRIQDTDAANDPDLVGCFDLSQVDLVVNERPTINQPAPLAVCDDMDGNIDGTTEFDLTSISSEVTTDPNIVVTYHTSQEDANDGIGDVTSATYSSNGETLYIRAENSTTGCYDTTTFEIEVNMPPMAEFDPLTVYEVCPNATVPISINVVPDNFTDSDVSVSWTLDGSPFTGNSLTLNNVLVAGTYEATITFNNSGCSISIETTVVELESCIFPEGISPNQDGMNDSFNLSSFNVTKLEIFNRNGTLVYSKDNYVDEWVGQTNDGDELPVGTYFYTVVYEGGAKSKSAWVYINR